MRDTRYSILFAIFLVVPYIMKGLVVLLLKMFKGMRLH